MYLFIMDYTYCVSILAVPFHMRENLIELFKENVDNTSSHLQPARKCCDFVDNYFPIILKENKLMLTIKNMSIAKMRDFVTAFVILLCSHCVKLVLKKFKVISSIFSKMYLFNQVPDDIALPYKTLGFYPK